MTQNRNPPMASSQVSRNLSGAERIPGGPPGGAASTGIAPGKLDAPLKRTPCDAGALEALPRTVRPVQAQPTHRYILTALKMHIVYFDAASAARKGVRPAHAEK